MMYSLDMLTVTIYQRILVASFQCFVLMTLFIMAPATLLHSNPPDSNRHWKGGRDLDNQAIRFIQQRI